MNVSHYYMKWMQNKHKYLMLAVLFSCFLWRTLNFVALSHTPVYSTQSFFSRLPLTGSCSTSQTRSASLQPPSRKQRWTKCSSSPEWRSAAWQMATAGRASACSTIAPRGSRRTDYDQYGFQCLNIYRHRQTFIIHSCSAKQCSNWEDTGLDWNHSQININARLYRLQSRWCLMQD